MDQNSPKLKIIKHISIVTSSSLIQSLGQLFHSYFGARWLGPDTFGAWQGARLIQSYLSYANLGIIHGIHRNAPLLRGQNRFDEIEKIKNCSWTFNIIVYAAVSIGLFITSFFISTNHEFCLSLRFVAILLEINGMIGFFYVWNNTNNRFEVVSTAAVITGITNIVTIYLIYYGKLFGFLFAKILVISLILIYYIYTNNTKLALFLNKSIILNEIKVGFPILLVTMSTTVFSTIDRILILNKLNFSNLGFYSLSGIIFMPITVVFNSINLVLYPRVTEKYGITNRTESLTNLFTTPLLILSHIIPFFIAALYLLIPSLVDIFLPKYEMGIEAAQIVIWGIFFYSLVGTVSNVIIAANKQTIMVFIIAIMTVLNYFFGTMMIKFGFGIVGVAISSTIIYFLYFLVLYFFAHILSKTNTKRLFIDLFYIIVPALVNILAVQLVNHFFDISNILYNKMGSFLIIFILLIVLNLKFFKKAFFLLDIKSLKDIAALYKFS